MYRRAYLIRAALDAWESSNKRLSELQVIATQGDPLCIACADDVEAISQRLHGVLLNLLKLEPPPAAAISPSELPSTNSSFRRDPRP